MSVRTALLMLTVLLVVQAAVALPAGVIIEKRSWATGSRATCDNTLQCQRDCDHSARHHHMYEGHTVRAKCVPPNYCKCWVDGVPW